MANKNSDLFESVRTRVHFDVAAAKIVETATAQVQKVRDQSLPPTDRLYTIIFQKGPIKYKDSRDHL